MLPELLLSYLVFVFSTTCHEFAHAIVALRGGDTTAYEGGHATLDPTPHIRRSPFGMVVIPILSFIQAGWMLGWASVPYNAHWGQRYPLRKAAMSLAGPAANFLLAAIALVALRVLIGFGVFEVPARRGFGALIALPEGVALSSPWAALGYALTQLFQLNVVLGLFNLIPLPPLDGAGVAEGVAPRRLGGLYDRLREVPMIELLGVILASLIFSRFAGPVLGAVSQLLYA
jgi:Zn-dependent protease